jgi:hypothetical protein
MELGPNVPHGFRHGAALDLAFLDCAGTAVDGFPPLRFGVSVHDIIKTGDETMGQECPVLNRQCRHFGDLFCGNAHIKKSNAMRILIKRWSYRRSQLQTKREFMLAHVAERELSCSHERNSP